MFYFLKVPVYLKTDEYLDKLDKAEKFGLTFAKEEVVVQEAVVNISFLTMFHPTDKGNETYFYVNNVCHKSPWSYDYFLQTLQQFQHEG